MPAKPKNNSKGNYPMISELIQADLLDWLRGNQWLAQNGYIPKAHAVFGDPPYFLGSITKRFGGKNSAPAQFGKDGVFQRQSRGFMGKTWDGFDDVWQYQAWVTEWASLMLDFVYPGAILALFGGTRTYHRIAAGLEDAGWEVYDCMMYVYGSGFPHAADIGKLIDKSESAEREIIGESNRGSGAIISKLANHDHGDTGIGYADGSGKVFNITAPTTENAKRFEGYKNLLKPAYEPIVLARAPRGNATYADLAQQWGTGALNIDSCRIDYKGDVDARTFGGSWKTDKAAKNVYEGGYAGDNQTVSEKGRYPANLIFDDLAAVMLDQQSGNRKAGSPKTGDEPSTRTLNIYGKMNNTTWEGYGDEGGASRFFYTAKAAAWEREAGLDKFPSVKISDGRRTAIDNPYQRGGKPYLQLRSDLDPDKREWIQAELKRRGIEPRG